MKALVFHGSRDVQIDDKNITYYLNCLYNSDLNTLKKGD